MTRAIIVLALLASCRGKSGFEATGSMVFANDVARDVDLFLATEAEILRSRSLVEHANEMAGSGTLTPSQIHVSRRGETSILDVRVTDTDPRRAEQLCNALMQTYAEQRLSQKLMVIDTRLEMLERDIETAKPEHRDALIRDRDALAAQRVPQNDVRLLDPCRNN